MATRRVLLIIGGGIAAYKSLDLIRRLRELDSSVRVILTRAAQEFVTPLAAGALSNDRVFTDLFDLDDEREIGHIRLSRDADLIVVAPATADLLAKLATGLANDLASAVLLATDKPVLVAPAMNPRMWLHPATQRNVRQLLADRIHFIGPNAGEMAEKGEAGVGRMAEAVEIADAADRLLSDAGNPIAGPLAGRHVLVTSGPTHEPIDPVRFIANRSSGKQGHAIAAAAAALGATVTLITGPVNLADPKGATVVKVETAEEMLEAVQAALPADVAVFAAAVADWKVESAAGHKLKKNSGAPPRLQLRENPDILRTIAKRGARRPALVIGFAAETENVAANAQGKRKDKGADWIVANDVSPETGTFGGDRNTVHLITSKGMTSWPPQSKDQVAQRLMEEAAAWLAAHQADV